MELTIEQKAELKMIELEMLKHFIEVCKHLNLKYYVMGGTLLGAVRHQGFIPWDDDIDVGMFREDYEIFVREGQKYLPKRYFIQTNKTDGKCPINFAKIRDNETTYIETSVMNFKMNHGVFIDIFPLDTHPDTKEEIDRFREENEKLYRVISKCFTVDKRIGALRYIYSRLRNVFSRKGAYQEAIEKRELLFKSNKGTKKIANYCSPWGEKEIVPIEWYGEGVELWFEGIKVNAPQEYHSWLKQVYGNYMEFPPEEKRVGHHYVTIIDLKKSYCEYMQ